MVEAIVWIVLPDAAVVVGQKVALPVRYGGDVGGGVVGVVPPGVAALADAPIDRVPGVHEIAVSVIATASVGTVRAETQALRQNLNNMR